MEHSVYISGLKKALKAREITYADLALRLKMTESGVKKMLNAKDVSFRRLLQICDVLDVLPGQLFSLSEKASVPTVRFTDAQENALLADRQLLMVYWRFTIEKRSPGEIANLSRLNAAAVDKSLRRLARLDLVTSRRGRFYPQHSGKFRWPDDSKIAKHLNREWSMLTLNRALNSKHELEHRLVALKLSRGAYQEFLRRFSNIFDEAAQVSEREELMSAKAGLTDVTALFAAVEAGVF